MRALADCSDVRGLKALGPLGGLELYLLAFRQTAETTALNCGVMTENVCTAVILSNETEALRIVKPLHCASCHLTLFFFRFEPQRRGLLPALVLQVALF